MPGELQESKVVVTVRYRIHEDEEDNSFVCHFAGLGLIARGSTEEEAVARCKRLYTKFVTAYRSAGQLAMRLDQAGVQWHWLEDYPDDAPAPEFTYDSRDRSLVPTADEFRKAIVEAQSQEREQILLPVAA